MNCISQILEVYFSDLVKDVFLVLFVFVIPHGLLYVVNSLVGEEPLLAVIEPFGSPPASGPILPLVIPEL